MSNEMVFEIELDSHVGVWIYIEREKDGDLNMEGWEKMEFSL